MKRSLTLASLLAAGLALGTGCPDQDDPYRDDDVTEPTDRPAFPLDKPEAPSPATPQEEQAPPPLDPAPDATPQPDERPPEESPPAKPAPEEPPPESQPEPPEDDGQAGPP